MVLLGSADFKYKVSGTDWGYLPEGWHYGEATSVASDSKDNIYIFNRGSHPMIVLSQNGDFIRSWGEGMFSNPHGIAIGPDDSVYCVDNGDHTVRKFTSDGRLLLTLGTAGEPSAPMSGKPFNRPTHVAIEPDTGNFYVADGYTNASVHKYSPDGKLLFSWGESGTGPGQFNIVHNITVDSKGWVYIADRENHRIQVFDSTGKFETQMVNLSRAAAVCIDNGSGEELMYIGEYFAGIGSNNMGTDLGPRVTIMNLKGEIKVLPKHPVLTGLWSKKPFSV